MRWCYLGLAWRCPSSRCGYGPNPGGSRRRDTDQAGGPYPRSKSSEARPSPRRQKGNEDMPPSWGGLASSSRPDLGRWHIHSIYIYIKGREQSNTTGSLLGAADSLKLRKRSRVSFTSISMKCRYKAVAI
jgi:hypothetical protein